MSGGGAIEAGRAYVRVELRNNIAPGIRDLQNRMRVFSAQMQAMGQSVARVGYSIASAFGAAVAGISLPVKLAADAEQLRTEFEVLTGSVAKAGKAVVDLQKFAAATPYGFAGLAQTTKLLLNYGVEVEQARKDIKRLAEVAGGSQEKLDRLALAFGQVASKGRLMGQEALQLTEAGFSPLQQLSEMTGESVAELSDRMAKGAIGFNEVRAALIAVTSAGGRFNGMMDKLAKTTSGQWAALKEEFADLSRALGEQLLPTVRGWIVTARQVVESVKNWVRNNESLGAVVGLLVKSLAVLTVSLGAIRLGLAGASAVSALFTAGLTAILKVSAGLSVLFGATAESAITSSAATTSAIDAAMGQTVLAVGSASGAVKALGTAFNRLGSTAGKALGKLQTIVGASKVALDAEIAAMVAAVNGLSLAGAAIDRATVVASAALTRFVATFNIAAGEVALAVGSINTATSGIGGAVAADAVSPLAGTVSATKKDAKALEATYDLLPEPPKSKTVVGTVDYSPLALKPAEAVKDGSKYADDLLDGARAAIDANKGKVSKSLSKVAKSGAGEFSKEMAGFTSSLATPKAFEKIASGLGATAKVAGKGVEVVGAGISRAAVAGAASLTNLIRPILTIGARIAAVGASVAAVVVAVGKIAIVVAAVTAIGAAYAYVADQAGLLKPIIKAVTDAVYGLVDAFKKTSKGISDALAVGNWQQAIKIAWLGARVAFYRGLLALTNGGGNLFVKFFGSLISLIKTSVQVTVNGIVQIAKSLPKVLFAAMTGFGNAVEIFKASLNSAFGDGQTFRDWAANAEKTFADELKNAEKARDEFNQKSVLQGSGTNDDAEMERLKKQQADRERYQRNLAAGVSRDAAFLPEETIKSANDAARERQRSLQEEIRELTLGQKAYDQYKLALEGVTQQNRAAIAALEAQKKAAEANKAVREQFKKLQEDILGIRFGSEYVDRYKLALDGADKALLANVEKLQRQKTFLEEQKNARDQLTEAVHGADAAKLLQLAQQGLTKEQVASIGAISALAKKMADLKSYSNDLKERFKSPLKKLEETQKQIRDAQLAGLLDQVTATKAITEALAAYREEAEKPFEYKGLQGASTSDERGDLFRKLREQQQKISDQAKARLTAADNQNLLEKIRSGAVQFNNPVDQATLEQLARQTDYLSKIHTNTAQPKVVVAIM